MGPSSRSRLLYSACVIAGEDGLEFLCDADGDDPGLGRFVKIRAHDVDLAVTPW